MSACGSSAHASVMALIPRACGSPPPCPHFGHLPPSSRSHTHTDLYAMPACGSSAPAAVVATPLPPHTHARTRPPPYIPVRHACMWLICSRSSCGFACHQPSLAFRRLAGPGCFALAAVPKHVRQVPTAAGFLPGVWADATTCTVHL
jgi:hypothetical protein